MSLFNSKKTEPHLPGEAGVWVFIMGDMIIFGLFFCVFLFYRANDTEMYSQSQSTLNVNYGILNTLFLLTSSFFVVLGIHAARNKLEKLTPTFFTLALACGLGFSVLKIIEYSEKIHHGITLVTNEFYMFYYILTGIHFLHVIIGMGALIYLIILSKRGLKNSDDIGLLESGASYWHMVDLLWIVLFPLLYLIK